MKLRLIVVLVVYSSADAKCLVVIVFYVIVNSLVNDVIFYFKISILSNGVNKFLSLSSLSLVKQLWHVLLRHCFYLSMDLSEWIHLLPLVSIYSTCILILLGLCITIAVSSMQFDS